MLFEQLIELEKTDIFGTYKHFLISGTFLDTLITNPTHFTFTFINKEQ